MLILNCHSPTALTPLAIDRCLSWPGPHLLVFDPVDAFDRATIAAAQRHFLTFEFASPPGSRFDALRAVILRAAHAGIALRGPLFYPQSIPSDAEVAKAAHATKQDNWLIEATTDPADGTLTGLILGAGIVENPLLEKLFSILEPAPDAVTTKACLQQIDTHLVWHGSATA